VQTFEHPLQHSTGNVRQPLRIRLFSCRMEWQKPNAKIRTSGLAHTTLAYDVSTYHPFHRFQSRVWNNKYTKTTRSDVLCSWIHYKMIRI